MALSAEQLTAINHESGNCRVISTAGSGKTTVITSRARRLVKDKKKSVLCLTFSRNAAENMSARADLPKTSARFQTFHSLCYHLALRYEAPLTAGRELLLEKDTWRLNAIAEAIAKDTGVTPLAIITAYNYASSFGYPLKSWETKLRHVEHIKHATALGTTLHEGGRYTFSDLVSETIQLLKVNEELRNQFKNTIDHVMVDEFQDTDYGQVQLLQLITNGSNLFVVGDPDQSIYGFRGSSNTYLTDFETHFGPVTTLTLSKNYRCLPNIVAAASSLMKDVPFRDDREIVADRSGKAVTKALQFDSPADEASEIAASIADFVARGAEYSQFSILSRTNSYLGAIEAELVTRKIPFAGVGDREGFFGLAEVKPLVEYARLALDMTAMTSLQYILNRPNRFLSGSLVSSGITSHDINAVKLLSNVSKQASVKPQARKAAADLASKLVAVAAAKDKPTRQFLLEVARIVDYDAYIRELATRKVHKSLVDMRMSLDTLLNSVATKFTKLKKFLDMVDMSIAQYKKNTQDTMDAVTLTTIHKAKGLEWPAVYVVGCSEGHIPHENATDLEEERRLMFVAMTRAEDILTLSCTQPSPLIADTGIPLAQMSVTNSAGAVDG